MIYLPAWHHAVAKPGLGLRFLDLPFLSQCFLQVFITVRKAVRIKLAKVCNVIHVRAYYCGGAGGHYFPVLSSVVVQ